MTKCFMEKCTKPAIDGGLCVDHNLNFQQKISKLLDKYGPAAFMPLNFETGKAIMNTLQDIVVAALVAKGLATVKPNPQGNIDTLRNHMVVLKSNDPKKWEWYYYVDEMGRLTEGTSLARSKSVKRSFKDRLLKP